MTVTATPFVAHADWSKNPAKRWVATARWLGSEYLVERPRIGSDNRRFLDDLQAEAKSTPLFVGFDFPIGVPASFGTRLGVDSFPTLLRTLGRRDNRDLEHFFSIARRPEEISCYRPFYPAAPGGTSQRHLTDALGVSGMGDLLRICERATSTRPAANSLFWTLGPKQVGHAAITGWRDVLAPAAGSLGTDLAIWPFDGSFTELLSSPRAVTIVETYPAEACLHVGIGTPGKGWSKRRQEDRALKARDLVHWLLDKPIVLSPGLVDDLALGFGPGESGEDPFDAVVGLISMLAVILGERGDGAPSHDNVRQWEGWILGQSC